MKPKQLADRIRPVVETEPIRVDAVVYPRDKTEEQGWKKKSCG
jgi:hypothetical protein